MSRLAVVGVCAVIVVAGGFTLISPFTQMGAEMRANAAQDRLSPQEIRARGGGSRGSVWSNLDKAKKARRHEGETER